ncbi:hypothetical protein SELMODRAFT_415887 [Selaginella moellendorffii]|uniref:PIPK domain-containing protein n=1 Tax=Selaginella moellendorffii TaxID=88036 RepID=D8RXK0_SELML|nr:hypothetical protein SELMODRAFT_415887 [Selaginella moellendorffii]
MESVSDGLHVLLPADIRNSGKRRASPLLMDKSQPAWAPWVALAVEHCNNANPTKYKIVKRGKDIVFSQRKANPRDVEVEILCADDFHNLRTRCSFPQDPEFANSLATARHCSMPSGKSPALWSRTQSDGDFVIKEVDAELLASFERISDRYFEYVDILCEERLRTMLVLVIAAFKVRMPGGAEHILLVMEALSSTATLYREYDLKGLQEPAGGISDGTLQVPLTLQAKDHETFFEILARDTFFLQEAEVFDYSLMVYHVPGRNELVVGIIDYLRYFTPVKHAFVALLKTLDGKPRSALHPKQYRKRMLEAFAKYFPCASSVHKLKILFRRSSE